MELVVVIPKCNVTFRFQFFISLLSADDISELRNNSFTTENSTFVSFKTHLYAPLLVSSLFLILFNDFLCKAKMILCTR